MFVQRLANALCDPAMNLAFKHQRIDHRAEIIDDGITLDFHLAGAGIDLKLNNMAATIKQAALVHDDTKSTILYIGNNSQTWRNSIVRRWNDKGLKVPCLNFDDEAKNFDACKMDIEGAEMPILENCHHKFSKLVYEWSFDIDPSLPRLWNVLDRQKQTYKIEAAWSSIFYETKEHKAWKSSWFPACTNVFCYAK